MKRGVYRQHSSVMFEFEDEQTAKAHAEQYNKVQDHDNYALLSGKKVTFFGQKFRANAEAEFEPKEIETVKIELREKRDHPFKPDVPIWRAYQIYKDGSEFNLRQADESVERLALQMKEQFSGRKNGLEITQVHAEKDAEEGEPESDDPLAEVWKSMGLVDEEREEAE